ncbi:MAG: tetratricopeptide repeat protein [Pseudomonadales bacterium]|nr:tetratricopeptide repeat protein [Pseudomonadales bacterium]
MTILLLLWCSVATARPYTPDSDDVVLARLPALSETLASPAPAVDPAEVLALARSQIDYASRAEDPRFLGYAQATLTPLIQNASSPAAELLMARIEQHRHQFARARHRLNQLLERFPNQGQAWLMLANIERVQGRLDAARQACRESAVTLPPTTVLLCQASVQAITNQRDKAYVTLQALAEGPAAPQGGSARWLATLLTEIALQQGDTDAAMSHLQDALQQAPQDPYLRYLQSDLWLTRNQSRSVIDDLSGWQDRDGALLRLAIAGQRLDHPRAEIWREQYRARMAADQDTGRERHLREHARFLLEVEDDPGGALALARENWRQQRELADLRILNASARATDDQDTRELIRDFINQHQVVDSQIPDAAKGADE